MAFSTKFVLEIKREKSAFWNISNSDVKRKILKSAKKVIFKKSGLSQEQKCAFSDFLIFFTFYVFGNAWELMKLWQKEIKPLHRYCPTATGTSVSIKFVLEVKVKNSVFRNISSSGVC